MNRKRLPRHQPTGGLGASAGVAFPFQGPPANVFRSSDMQFSKSSEGDMENPLTTNPVS